MSRLCSHQDTPPMQSFKVRQAIPEIFRPLLECSPIKNRTRFYWYLGKFLGWIFLECWWRVLEVGICIILFFVGSNKCLKLTELNCQFFKLFIYINQPTFYSLLQSKSLWTAPCITGLFFVCGSVCFFVCFCVPENHWFEDDVFLWGSALFQGAFAVSSFRGGCRFFFSPILCFKVADLSPIHFSETIRHRSLVPSQI